MAKMPNDFNLLGRAVRLATWAAASAAVLLAGPVAAETWGERLGFPAGKKVVVLHAHGMGVSFEANAAGEQLATQTLPFSCCAVAPGPWFTDFALWTHRTGSVDVGLELTLNSEHASYRWQPIAPDHRVGTLIDTEGYLWSRSLQTMVNADADEVDFELRSQIERALKRGMRPTHLTAHLGTLFTRLDLIETYLQISRDYWIPAVLVELTPASIARFQQMGFPLDPAMVDLIQNYPLPKLDDLQFVPTEATYEAKRAGLLQVIAKLQPGLTQIAVAPVVESAALPRIADDWQQRVWDLQLLKDSQVRKALTADDVVLTTWGEINRRYHGTGMSPGERMTSEATDPAKVSESR